MEHGQSSWICSVVGLTTDDIYVEEVNGALNTFMKQHILTWKSTKDVVKKLIFCDYRCEIPVTMRWAAHTFEYTSNSLDCCFIRQ